MSPERRHTLCASLRSQHARQDFTRATLCGNLQVKCRRPKPPVRLCAGLRSRNACQDFTRATLYGNLQVKCRRPKSAQNADEDFVPACAVETHVKISQEPLYTEIYGENAAGQSEHPDQAPTFTPTVRTSVDTVWGKNILCWDGHLSITEVPCFAQKRSCIWYWGTP